MRNKTKKSIRGGVNNTRTTVSKYKNINKRIENYQQKLRNTLKASKTVNINNNFNINNSTKAEILENIGISIDELIAIIKNTLKKFNRNVIYYRIFINEKGGLTSCYKKGGSCLASYILNITFYDNHGFKYVFGKKKFGSDPAINHNELSRVIFFEVSGFNYNKKYELTNINDIDTILELPKSIAISKDILDFIKKIDRYDLLQTDVNLHLTNYLQSLIIYE